MRSGTIRIFSTIVSELPQCFSRCMPRRIPVLTYKGEAGNEIYGVILQLFSAYVNTATDLNDMLLVFR
jgi:hypothetical protein